MREQDEFSPPPLTPEYVVYAVRQVFPWFLSEPDQDNPDFHEEYLTQDPFLHLYTTTQEEYDKYIVSWQEALQRLKLDTEQARALFEPMLDLIVGAQITPTFAFDVVNNVSIVSFYVEKMSSHDFNSRVFPSFAFNKFKPFPPPLTANGEIFTGWLSKPLINPDEQNLPTVKTPQSVETTQLGPYL